MRVDMSCPVEIYDYELPSDAQPYCALVFLNLDMKMVTSVQVSLSLLDADGHIVSRRMERVSGFHATSKELFEANVSVGDEFGWLQAIDLAIEKVWFDDATVWRRVNVPYQVYDDNRLAPGPVLEQLQSVAGTDAVGFPSDQVEIWVCVCGRPNTAAESICRRCARDRKAIFEQYNSAAVQAIVDERERQRQEKLRLAREEAARVEHQCKQAAQRKRRKRRIRVAAITASVVIVAGSYLFVTYGWPELRYRQAQGKLTGGEPEQAKEILLQLGPYKQAELLIRDADFHIAVNMLSGTPAEHEEGLRRLDAMTEYPAAQLQAKKTRYEDALAAIDAGEYEQAEKLLQVVGVYGDSVTRLNQTVYRIADQLMEKGAFEDALARFRSIPDYEDAPDRASDCIYRMAEKERRAERYLAAAELYSSISSYADAVDMARECVYQHAVNLRNEGKYEEARAQFEKLVGYKDAAEQALECVYGPAIARMQAGEYETAARLFAAIPEYKDAKDLAQECVYLPARALQEQKKYQAAAALFATIPDFQDAALQQKISLYQVGQQQKSQGELLEAAETFAALGDYSDAKAQAQAARYDAAAMEQDAKGYEKAQDMFEALGTYKDAAKRANQCQYAQASALMTAGDLQEARTLFRELGAYADAKTLANRCGYKEAEAMREGGMYEEAAALFDTLGKFEDADDQADACRYAMAEAYELARNYEKAGQAFAALGKYRDAKDRSEQAFDTWLSTLQDAARVAMRQENYVQVLQLMETGNATGDLPKKYNELEGMYRQANLSYAKQLIASGNSLPAYPYLQRVADMKEAKKLLKNYAFIILGSWESADGVKLTFNLDGSCIIGDQKAYFNVDGYGLMIGDTPRPAKRAYSIVLLDEKKLTLQPVETGNATRYNRTASVE